MPKTWLPLDDDHRRFVCDEILRQLEVAKDPHHAAWAIKILNECLWFWTVDGQDADGAVGRDKLKYDTDLRWHSERTCGLTREACAAHQPAAVRLPKKELRHEHVVPRRIIVARLQSSPRLDAAGVLDLLERCCLGVVLTKEEDGGLNAVFKNSMPPGWSADDPKADSFARYRHPRVGLYDRLHPPRGRPAGGGSGVSGGRKRPLEPRPLGAPAAPGPRDQDPRNTAVTLEVIADLKARHGLSNALFKRLHHGKSPSIANHVAYYEKSVRIESETNVAVCRRLLECRERLDEGATWEEAIAAALGKYPLAPR